MSKFKPMMYHFDEDGYNRAKQDALLKIDMYKKAEAWAGNHIKVDAPKAFADSFTSYFKYQFYQKYKNKVQLDISVDKILNLMDIEIAPLQAIEIKFKENRNELIFKDGLPDCIVDEDKFKRFTTSSKDNEILRAGNKFIEALARLDKHTKVYPLNIKQATSNLIGFDMRSQKYSVNLQPTRA